MLVPLFSFSRSPTFCIAAANHIYVRGGSASALGNTMSNSSAPPPPLSPPVEATMKTATTTGIGALLVFLLVAIILAGIFLRSRRTAKKQTNDRARAAADWLDEGNAMDFELNDAALEAQESAKTAGRA